MGQVIDSFFEIVTNNSNMLSIFSYIESIAKTPHPILITGETGVGKELIAKSIHEGSQKKGELVTINVAGLDDSIFSDTLFGHAKGAFTGAENIRKGMIDKASGGTLFLDEIGDLSPLSQVKLLRLLQDGEYIPLGMDEVRHANIRILTCTNQDLWELQRNGRFRADLNFRLRTHHINVPPLRKRKDDIPLLFVFFLNEAAAVLKRDVQAYTPELISYLKEYPFPGNIRELKGIVFDAVSRTTSDTLTVEVFRSILEHEGNRGNRVAGPENSGELLIFSDELPTIKEAADILVKEAVKRSKGNQTVAAKMLGISRQALGKRLKG